MNKRDFEQTAKKSDIARGLPLLFDLVNLSRYGPKNFNVWGCNILAKITFLPIGQVYVVID